MHGSRSDQLTVMVTGAGAPGIRGTVYALRNNPESTAVRIIGTDTRQEAVGQYFVDKFYVVPQPEDPEYVNVLQNICAQEQVSVLIPQTTRESLHLSRCKQRLASSTGTCIMAADAEALETANSKWQLLKEAEKLEVPVPAHALANSEKELVNAVSQLGYPSRSVVIKPLNSNGMRGVRILREAAWDLNRFLSEKPSGLEISLADLVGILRRGSFWPTLLVSEYLPGPEYSVDVFIGRHIRIAIPRVREEIRSGITFGTRIEMRADLIDYSLRTASGLNLLYTCGFQFKLDENGIPKLLECNPRVQGTMVASVFSGPNVIWLGVKEALGEFPSVALAVANNISFQRYWGGVGIQDTYVAEI